MHATPAPTAEPVLLLPDVARTWWSWRRVLPHLGGKDRTVIALDPRGVGATDRTPTGYDWADGLADLAAVLGEVSPGRAVLVGHGWGGLTALGVATHRPDLVAGLALVAAPAPRVLQRYRRLLLASRLGSRVLSPARLHRWSGLGQLEPGAPCLESLRQWPGPQRTIAPLRRTSTRNLRRLTPPPDVPVLQVRASLDRLLPSPRRGVHDAVVIEGPHHLPEHTPEALTDTLRTWLSTLT